MHHGSLLASFQIIGIKIVQLRSTIVELVSKIYTNTRHCKLKDKFTKELHSVLLVADYSL